MMIIIISNDHDFEFPLKTEVKYNIIKTIMEDTIIVITKNSTFFDKNKAIKWYFYSY